jgi:hypothetical protein
MWPNFPPPLTERIIGEVDPWDHVAGMEGNLLGLGEIIVGIAVQRQLADAAHRNDFLRDQLSRVEEVEVEFELVFLLNDLQPQLPVEPMIAAAAPPADSPAT